MQEIRNTKAIEEERDQKEQDQSDDLVRKCRRLSISFYVNW